MTELNSKYSNADTFADRQTDIDRHDVPKKINTLYNHLLVGERERDRERHGVGSEKDCVLVEQSTFPFIHQDQF